MLSKVDWNDTWQIGLLKLRTWTCRGLLGIKHWRAWRYEFGRGIKAEVLWSSGYISGVWTTRYGVQTPVTSRMFVCKTLIYISHTPPRWRKQVPGRNSFLKMWERFNGNRVKAVVKTWALYKAPLVLLLILLRNVPSNNDKDIQQKLIKSKVIVIVIIIIITIATTIITITNHFYLIFGIFPANFSKTECIILIISQ